MGGGEDKLRGFACPSGSFDRAFLDTITRARSARLAELFLKCFGRALNDRASGLAEIVASFRAEPGAFPACWPTAMGALRGAMLAGNAPLARSAALALALEQAEHGVELELRVALDEPTSLRFSRFALPKATTVSLESDGTSVRIALDDALVELSFTGGEWHADLEALPRVRSALLLDADPPEGLVRLTAPDLAIYQATYDLIADHAPGYLPWVERVVRGLIPVQARPGATTSSSFELLPGVVALSQESPVICLADALVHEASHQHYYLVTQVGPVHDGSDQALYFSPAVQRERPIDKILLAYHAFANVLLFYRACRESGFADPELCLRREASYAESLAVLDAPLAASRALTRVGSALYRPLAERIGASAPAAHRETVGAQLPLA